MVRMVRVIDPAAVRDPENPGRLIVPDPRQAYREDSAVVQAYPWMFAADDDSAGQIRSIETAANDGGSQTIRRGPGRPRKTVDDEDE